MFVRGPFFRNLLYAVMLLLAAAALLSACAREPRGVRVEFPIIPNAESVERGEGIYQAYCVSCHGDEDNPTRLAGAPPHDETGHTWHHPDRQLFEWVLDGPPNRTVMPAFRGVLEPEQVIAVLAYIKTMWPEDIQRNQTEFSRQYEAQISGTR